MSIDVKHIGHCIDSDGDVEDPEALSEVTQELLANVGGGQPDIKSPIATEGPAIVGIALSKSDRIKICDATGQKSTISALKFLIKEALAGGEKSTATEPRVLEVEWKGSTLNPLCWHLEITEQSHILEEFNPGSSDPMQFEASNGMILRSAGRPEWAGDQLFVGGSGESTGEATFEAGVDSHNLIPNQEKKRIDEAIEEYLEHHNAHLGQATEQAEAIVA